MGGLYDFVALISTVRDYNGGGGGRLYDFVALTSTVRVYNRGGLYDFVALTYTVREYIVGKRFIISCVRDYNGVCVCVCGVGGCMISWLGYLQWETIMGKGLYDFVVLTSTVRDYNGGGLYHFVALISTVRVFMWWRALWFRGLDIYSKRQWCGGGGGGALWFCGFDIYSKTIMWGRAFWFRGFDIYSKRLYCGGGLYDFVALTSTVRDYNVGVGGGGALWFRGLDIYSKRL